MHTHCSTCAAPLADDAPDLCAHCGASAAPPRPVVLALRCPCAGSERLLVQLGAVVACASCGSTAMPCTPS